MKTSNKLLIGFFSVVVITMAIGNLALKRMVDKQIDQIHQTMPNAPVEPDAVQEDSL